jgi:hypothetical protein
LNVAVAAVLRIIQGVPALTVALDECATAFTFTPHTGLTGPTHVATLTAVAGVNVQVGAVTVGASYLTRETRVPALVESTHLLRPADGAARSAVFVVGSEIHALPVAVRLAGGALTCARDAILPGSAAAATSAAVGLVRQEIDAPVIARAERAVALAHTGNAALPWIASAAARTAILRIGVRVNTRSVTSFLWISAGTFSRGTALPWATAPGAGPAVRGIASYCDTHTATVQAARRALADARVTRAAAATGLPANAAVVVVERQINTQRLARLGARRARTRSRLAALSGETGKVATATMLRIFQRVYTGSATLDELCRARCGASAERTHLARGTGHRAVTAVLGVTVQIDAGAVTRSPRNAGALARGAGFARGAHAVTRSTVPRVARRVETLCATLQVVPGASAAAGKTALLGWAQLAAVAAVAFVASRIDAAAVAAQLARRAHVRAHPRGAHFVGRTRDSARSAMLGIGLDRDAASVAFASAFGACTNAADAHVTIRARVAAAAAVRRIRIGRYTSPVTADIASGARAPSIETLFTREARIVAAAAVSRVGFEYYTCKTTRFVLSVTTSRASALLAERGLICAADATSPAIERITEQRATHAITQASAGRALADAVQTRVPSRTAGIATSTISGVI